MILTLTAGCVAAFLCSAAPKTADVEPAEIRTVRAEKIKLSPKAPQAWHSGTHLRQLCTLGPGRGTVAPGAIDAESVVVRHGDVVLELGKDYLLDKTWGALGIGPDSRVTVNDIVTVDYAYSLLRIDSLVRTADGREELRRGASELTVPVPPPLGAAEKRIANVFVPYHSDGKGCEVLPVLETAEEAKTLTARGRISKAMAKIRAKQPVTIVCWGDSVTCGGDASCPEMTYPMQFARMLKREFPDAPIDVKVVAIGGSNSQQWLYPDRIKPQPGREKEFRWERVTEPKPDVVTVEFVNDAWLKDKQVEAVYSDILNRVRGAGSELIIITPHFTMMPWMGFKTFLEKDGREYVHALRRFAEKHNVALADASARWEHLWMEGLPYVTLLKNGINHPDDRGHALFAEELIKCFAE